VSGGGVGGGFRLVLREGEKDRLTEMMRDRNKQNGLWVTDA